jgi:hypothetical protein
MQTYNNRHQMTDKTIGNWKSLITFDYLMTTDGKSHFIFKPCIENQ